MRMLSTSVRSCSAFIWNAAMKRSFIRIKSSKSYVSVERGVATRMTQVVWPMMIVTATNFEGFTRRQF